MVMVHSGIKVVDDAISKIEKKRCSILVVGKKAAETFTFQLAKSFCEKGKPQSGISKRFQTVYVNFNDSDENFSEKAMQVGWGSKNEKPEDLFDAYIDMYDRRSVGGIDAIVKEISDKIDRIRNEKREESLEEVLVIVNSLSRLALYLGEEKVLNFLSTMNFLKYDDINLLVFFFLNDSLHEPLFTNRVKSLVDSAIVFREDYKMEITENFFGLEGFGESSIMTKWYPCLDLKERGIVPVDFLEMSKEYRRKDEESKNGKEIEKEKEIKRNEELKKHEKLKKKVEFAEARKIIEYCKGKGFLSHDELESYEHLVEDEEELVKWMKRKQKEYSKKDLKTFRTGIWAIDRLFSEKTNLLGGMEQLFGIAIVYDIHLIDMYPFFAKILCRCFEEDKSFIEISTEDNPELLLESLEYSHGMYVDRDTIREELLKKEKSHFRFINCYGAEPSEDEFKKCDNITYTDTPYNITILYARYKDARESINKELRRKGDETGPIIWLNSYSNLASVSSVENAYSFSVNTIMARDIWSPQEKWFSLMLFSMQRGFLSKEDEQTLLQVSDGIIEFKSRRILGNRIYYFRVPKMPNTDKTVPWTPYKIMEEKLGFLPLDEETVYHYLNTGILEIKGGMKGE
jgi:KaiC/GvpD/RAD55 family RecA-like ATPase